jgi:AAA domain/UvrD-like helicase C-terminal domain
MKKTRPELDTLSDGQRDALDAIVKWYGDVRDDPWPAPLKLGGWAGTGKSTLVGLLPDVLPKRTQIVYIAYTGKAVSVLASKLPDDARVSTIHKLLYSPVEMTTCTESGEMLPGKVTHCSIHRDREAECPAVRQVSFTPVAEPLAGLDLVVVDEASMVPERLWEDLTSHGVPVLAVGDHGQLPPVKSAFNLMQHPDLRLEEIHRQAAGSPILTVAQWAREQGYIPHGWFGENVVKIGLHELGLPGLGLHPAQADLIICATNATRQYHNAGVRALHGRSGPPAEGDVVICLRNNYDAGLFNGQRGIVLACEGPGWNEKEPAYQMAIAVDGLDDPWEGAVAVKPFGQPPAAAAQVRDRDLALFDFGYALTGHRSQGSQADKVIVIEEGWPDPGTEMRRRWLYTVVTRAAKELTVAGW